MAIHYYTCEYCGKQFTRPRKVKNARFCSRRCGCLATVAGKNKNRLKKNCPICGIEFEFPVSQSFRVTCSKKCLGILQSRERKGIFGVGESNPMYRGGIQLYRQYKKESCERCGESKRKLVVHHKDRDRYNNIESNLETLCYSCHLKEHEAERPRDSLGKFTFSL